MSAPDLEHSIAGLRLAQQACVVRLSLMPFVQSRWRIPRRRAWLRHRQRADRRFRRSVRGNPPHSTPPWLVDSAWVIDTRARSGHRRCCARSCRSDRAYRLRARSSLRRTPGTEVFQLLPGECRSRPASAISEPMNGHQEGSLVPRNFRYFASVSRRRGVKRLTVSGAVCQRADNGSGQTRARPPRVRCQRGGSGSPHQCCWAGPRCQRAAAQRPIATQNAQTAAARIRPRPLMIQRRFGYWLRMLPLGRSGRWSMVLVQATR